MTQRCIPWILAFLLLAPCVSAREYKGLEIPETMETPAGVLVLNGVGERHIFAESVYMAALYLEQPEKNWREVVEKKAPMAIRLQVTQAFFATSTRIRDAIEKGFENNMPNGDVRLNPEKMQSFMDCFAGEIQTGDVFVIRYIPDQGTMVLKNGTFQGVMTGSAFKKAVFGIWLGERPAQASLKQGLLAADVSEEALALRKAKQMTAKENRPKTAAAEAKAQGEVKKPEASPAAANGKKPAGTRQAQKTPEEAAADEELKKRVFSENIYFPLGENRLTDTARRKLDRKAAWMKAHPDAKVLIAGHSDSQGPADVNFELAEKRARQVKAYMAAAGISERRMVVRSYGEKRPLAVGNTPAARARNRRVDFTLIE